MSEHIVIQNTENYTLTDYQDFEHRLFSHDTDKNELENICMTLAHIPSKEAQALLKKFRKSVHANKVSWLKCAIDEGQMHYLEPCNEQEEQDFLALKVIQELEDNLLDLEMEYNKADLNWRKYEIQLQAVKSLATDGELDENAHVTYDNKMSEGKRHMTELNNEIKIQEKIIERIRVNIQTERYKNVDTMTMQHYHFDGEE